MLDILFRSKDVEKAGTGFQRVNELCNQYGVSWTFRKEAYGFFFEFIRPNVQINVHLNVELSAQEQLIYNLIDSNLGISKAELAIRIGKSEKTVLYSSLLICIPSIFSIVFANSPLFFHLYIQFSVVLSHMDAL